MAASMGVAARNVSLKAHFGADRATGSLPILYLALFKGLMSDLMDGNTHAVLKKRFPDSTHAKIDKDLHDYVEKLFESGR